MIRTTRILDKAISQKLVCFDITKAQLDVLFVISFSDCHSLRACEIAEELFVSKPNISVILRHLFKKKYVLANADAQDFRAQLISLTQKAEKLLDSILPEFFNVGNRALNDFSEKEKEGLLSKLYHIEKQMNFTDHDFKEEK